MTATEGKILTYKGKPAFTQFSSSSGGWTSAGGQPYLVAKRDPYDDHAGNAMHSWTTQVNVGSLEAAHPEIGTLVDMRVTKRESHGAWGGRVLQIRLNGTKGIAFMTGEDFRWKYGLRSNWFTIEPDADHRALACSWVRRSPSLGQPKSGEYKVVNGRGAELHRGRIYWRKGIGASELRGRDPGQVQRRSAGRRRRSAGRPPAWPTRSPVARRCRFQKGRMYYVARVGGAYVRQRRDPAATGRRQARRRRSSASRPSDVKTITGGTRGTFEHGTITWNRKTNTFTVTMD